MQQKDSESPVTKDERDFISNALRETANDSYLRELRVQFATAALNGIMADHTITMDAQGVAKVCWSVADAMLATMKQDAGG